MLDEDRRQLVGTLLQRDRSSDPRIRALVRTLLIPDRQRMAARELLQAAQYFPARFGPNALRALVPFFSEREIAGLITQAFAVATDDLDLWREATEEARRVLGRERVLDEGMALILGAALERGFLEPTEDFAAELVRSLELPDTSSRDDRRSYSGPVTRSFALFANRAMEKGASQAIAALRSGDAALASKGLVAVTVLLDRGARKAPLAVALAILEAQARFATGGRGALEPRALVRALGRCMEAAPRVVAEALLEAIRRSPETSEALVETFRWSELTEPVEQSWLPTLIAALTDRSLTPAMREGLASAMAAALEQPRPASRWRILGQLLVALEEVCRERDDTSVVHDTVGNDVQSPDESPVWLDYLMSEIAEAAAIVGAESPDETIDLVEDRMRAEGALPSLQFTGLCLLGELGHRASARSEKLVYRLASCLGNPDPDSVRRGALEGLARLVRDSPQLLDDDVLTRVAGELYHSLALAGQAEGLRSCRHRLSDARRSCGRANGRLGGSVS